MSESPAGIASLEKPSKYKMSGFSLSEAHAPLASAIGVADSSTVPTSEGKPLTSTALSTDTAHDDEAEAELLKRELQLIQLCFAEHEFGILMEDDSDETHGEANSSSGDVSSSLSSSRRSSTHSGDGHQRHRLRRIYPYDPLAFVNGKVQHGVPLLSLSEDLHTYAEYLKEKIAQCVNTDIHTAFVNVSGHLVGMRDELSYMERPLTSAMEKISTVVGQLSATSQAVKCSVEAACAAEMERAFDAEYLRCMVMYETVAYHLDDLAGLLHVSVDSSTTIARDAAAAGIGTDNSNVPSFRATVDAREGANKGGVSVGKGIFLIAPESHFSDTTLDALEDVVLFFQELKETCHRLGSLPSREQERLEALSYVEAAEQSVMGILKAVLIHTSQLVPSRGLESGSAPLMLSPFSLVANTVAISESINAGYRVAPKNLGRVIELYAQVGDMTQFCVVFRNAVVRPPLEGVISWKSATKARQSVEDMVTLLKEIKGVLQNTVLPLLPLLRKHYGTSLHPASTIVWPVLSETLVKKLPSLCEVGIPNHFQIKYKAAYDLLSLVEGACSDLEELSVLRQSPDVVLWNHKWNLNIYATLRMSEMEKALQSVSSPLDCLPASANSDYHCRLFYIAQQQLLHLFSSSVFILQCTPSFLRHTVVFCYRMLARVQEATIKASSNMGGGVTLEEKPADTTPSENGVSPGEDGHNILLLAIADAHTLRTFLIGKLLHVILGRLEAESGGARTEVTSATPNTTSALSSERSTRELVKDVLEFASVTVCGQFVDRARAALVRQITEAAIVPLQGLKSVRSAYSHTRKTMPSAASWYVAPALHPLEKFAEEAEKRGLSGAALQDCVAVMLQKIMDHFVSLARETLITAKKTEESWEKLRRRKEGSAASQSVETAPGNGVETSRGAPSTAGEQRVTAETASDRDKMTIQLWIDARAMFEGAQTPPLNLSSETAIKLFESAFDLLRRAEWIQGADIPEPPDVDV